MIAFGLIPPIAIVLVPAILGPSKRHQKDRTKKDRTLKFSSTSNSSSDGRYKALNIKLKLYPIFREVRLLVIQFCNNLVNTSIVQCGFYILGLLLFLATIKDGKIGLWESILIVGGKGRVSTDVCNFSDLSYYCACFLSAYLVYLSFVLSGLKSRKVLAVPSDGSKDGETDFLVQDRDAE